MQQPARLPHISPLNTSSHPSSEASISSHFLMVNDHSPASGMVTTTTTLSYIMNGVIWVSTLASPDGLRGFTSTPRHLHATFRGYRDSRVILV